MVLDKIQVNKELKIWKNTKLEINNTVKQVLEIAKISDKQKEKILKNTNSIKDLVEKMIKLDSKNIELAKFLFNINYKPTSVRPQRPVYSHHERLPWPWYQSHPETPGAQRRENWTWRQPWPHWQYAAHQLLWQQQRHQWLPR